MKKKLLSILLAVCMMLSLLPTSAFATGTNGKGISDADGLEAILGNGIGYLTANITLNSGVTVTGDVTLDLAGNSITGRLGGASLITVASGGKLTIKDGTGGGQICNNGDGYSPQAFYTIKVQSGGTVELKGGCVTVGSGNAPYSVEIEAGGKFTVSGGTVESAIKSLQNSGTLEVSGGEVTCSVANRGSMTVSDGTVSGNLNNGDYTAMGKTLTVTGGTISGKVTNNSSTVTISGGTISGGVDNVEGASTLNANGGTIGNVSNYGTITRAADSGYTTFTGTVENKTKSSSGTMVEGKVENIACPYTVTYKYNNGDVDETWYVLKGQKATKVTDPTNGDKTFGGWYESGTFAGEKFDFDTVLTASVTLFAKWDDAAAEHEHSWETKWTYNATNHWHECDNSDCTVTDNSQKDGYAAHQWNASTGKCTECGYECTHTDAESNKTFNDNHKCTTCGWECTTHTYGTDGKCTTCGAEQPTVTYLVKLIKSSGSVSTEYPTYAEAYAQASNGDTIQLLQDVVQEVGNDITVCWIEKGITLDLNGHSFEYGANKDMMLKEKVSMTITDTSSDSTRGALNSKLDIGSQSTVTLAGGVTVDEVVVNNATLKVENATIEMLEVGTSDPGNSGGTLIMSGGSVTEWMKVYGKSSVTLSGGTFKEIYRDDDDSTSPTFDKMLESGYAFYDTVRSMMLPLDKLNDATAHNLDTATKVVECTSSTHSYDSTSGKCQYCGTAHDHTFPDPYTDGKCTGCGYACDHGWTTSRGIDENGRCSNCHWQYPVRYGLTDGNYGWGTLLDANMYDSVATLFGDVTDNLGQRNNSYTIDLNGHTLTQEYSDGYVNDTGVVIKDGSTSGGGTIKGLFKITGGTVTLHKGIILADGIKTTVSGETLMNYLADGTAYANENGTVISGDVTEISETVKIVAHNTHDYDETTGKCACGYEHDHDTCWNDGKCTECGYECKHEGQNENATTCTICGATLTVTYYDVWVLGIQVTSKNMNDVLGDDDEGATVVYTPATATAEQKLTLTGAQLTYAGTSEFNAAIEAHDSLTVELQSTTDSYGNPKSNKITLTPRTTPNYTQYGIKVVRPDDAEADDKADRTLTITGRGGLFIETKEDTNNNRDCAYGLYADGNVKIWEYANFIDVNSGSANHISYGIYARNGDVTIGGVDARAGYVVSAYGGKVTNSADKNALSRGIVAERFDKGGNVTISGGTVMVQGGVATSANKDAHSNGIYATNITISGTNAVYAPSNSNNATANNGTTTTGGIYVAGGKLTISATDSPDISIETNATGTVELSGGSYESLSTLNTGTTLAGYLADNKAFANSSDSSLVDGGVSTLENVTIVDHTHKYDETTGKCACGAECKHENIGADDKCNDCGKQVYVAQIVGGIKYATFDAAYAAASNGDTIKLLADATRSDAIEKNLTIQLNSHKLDKSSYLIIESTVTIEGTGTIDWLQVDGTNADVTLKGGVTAKGVAVIGGGKLTVESANITSNLDVGSSSYGDGTLTMSDGTVKKLTVYAGSTAKLSGGTFDSGVTCRGGTVSGLLADGYAFKQTTGAAGTTKWYDKYNNPTTGDISGEVTVMAAPITAVSITTTDGKENNTYTYGELVHLKVTVTTDNTREIILQWYVDGNKGDQTTAYDTTVTTWVNNLSVGSHTFCVEVTINGYTMKSNTLTVEVEKADLPTFKGPVAMPGLTYNGESQSLVGFDTTNDEAAGTILSLIFNNECKLWLRVGENGAWSSDECKATNAGTYTVYWYIDGGDNYNNVGSKENAAGSVEVTIERKTVTPTVSVAIGSGFVYDGNEKKPAVTVMDGNTLIPETEYSVAYSNNINAGTATATVTCKDGGNYVWDEPVTQNFTIQKAAALPLTDYTVDQCYAVETEQRVVIDLTQYGFPAGETIDSTGVDLDNITELTGVSTTVNYAGCVGTNLTVSYYIDDATSANINNTVTFPITISTQNYEKMTLNVIVTLIDKEVKDLFVTMPGWTYGETPATPSFTTYDDDDVVDGRVEYKVKDTDDSTYTATVPTNAGNYTVKVYYETITAIYIGTADFSISPKSITNEMVALSGGLTYTGKLQSPTVTVTDGSTTLVKDTDYSISKDSSGTNAGNYTIAITGEGNYTGTVNKGWSIGKAALSASVTASNKTYDGTTDATVNVTFTGLQNGEELVKGTDYTVTANFASADANYLGTSVTYTVTLSDNDKTKNYSLSNGTGTTTAIIWEKSITATITAEDKVYDGTTTATVTATVDPDDLIAGDEVIISGLTGEFEDANVGDNKPVSVDTPNGLHFEGNGWYNYIVTAQFSGITASITPAKSEVLTAPTAKFVIFNGQPQELIEAGTASGGTMMYSLDGGQTWSAAIPTATTIGDYTVSYYVKGDGNHNDCSGGTISVSILPNEITVTVTYQGAFSQTPTTVEETVKYGEPYSIKTPAIDGYQADVNEVKGTAGLEDVDVTVTYTCTHEQDNFGICAEKSSCGHSEGCTCHPDTTHGTRTLTISTRNGGTWAAQPNVSVALIVNPNTSWNAKHEIVWTGFTGADGTVQVPEDILKAIPAGASVYASVNGEVNEDGQSFDWAWTDISYGKLRIASAEANCSVTTSGNNDYLYVKANEGVGFTASFTVNVKEVSQAAPVVAKVNFVVKDVNGNLIDTTKNNVVMNLNKRVNGKATVIGTTGLIDGKGTVKIDASELAGLAIGTVLDCDPSGNYQWALDEMAIVRTMSIDDGTIGRTANPNQDAIINAEALSTGFEITFYCTVKSNGAETPAEPEPTPTPEKTYKVNFHVVDVNGNAISGVTMQLNNRVSGVVALLNSWLSDAPTDANGNCVLTLTEAQVKALKVGTVLDCDPTGNYQWAIGDVSIVRTMSIDSGSIERTANPNQDGKLTSESINGFELTFTCIIKAK